MRAIKDERRPTKKLKTISSRLFTIYSDRTIEVETSRLSIDQSNRF